MKKAIIIILTALLVLSTFVSCSDDCEIDDEFTRTITFDANGGTGKMNPQTIPRRTISYLVPNTFTQKDKLFTGWNTKADGSGVSFRNRAMIVLLDDMTLYAQWADANTTN